MSSSPHYFVAIPLPESLQDHFSTWQENLQEKLSYKQWPNKQDLHITLKFLGAIADNKLHELQDELNNIEDFREFSINVGTIGTFGNPSNPRVLWAGVEKTQALSKLYETVEAYASNKGFEKEKRTYRPHITLAKKWAGDSFKKSLQKIAENYTEQKTLHVEEVVLYQIFPQKNPKYQVVDRFKLKGGGQPGSVN